MELKELMIRYDCGDLVFSEIIELFSQLIITGRINNLKGTYPKVAQQYLDAELILSNGAINHRMLRTYIDQSVKRCNLFK